MICIELFGGLGNQMFQYAFGAALAETRNTNLVLDTTSLDHPTEVDGTTPRLYGLNIFPNIIAPKVSGNDLKKAKPLYLRMLNYLVYKLTGNGIRHSQYYIQNAFFYDEKIARISKQCYVTGYWQSYKYLLSCDALIRSHFQFPVIKDEDNLRFIEQIESTESVSIHIRRSDYLKAYNLETHGICSLSYYQSAIDYISKKITNPVFFIFSDDMDWVVENIGIQYPHFYVNHNRGQDSYRDMQLMAACKHNIIANSSFSWWGGWLNDTPAKIIVAPAKWFNNKKGFVYSDLVPPTWISL